MGISIGFRVRQPDPSLSLKVFDRIPARRQNIAFDIHPESQDKIDDQWRAHSEKRDVNKPGPDTGSGYAHSLSDRRTHSENLPLDEVLESVHVANLKKIRQDLYY